MNGWICAVAAPGAGLPPETGALLAARIAVRGNTAAVAHAGELVGAASAEPDALRPLLARRGVPAELRLGVQVYPFYAHAWVELHGEPVNEDPETVAKFRALPEVVV